MEVKDTVMDDCQIESVVSYTRKKLLLEQALKTWPLAQSEAYKQVGELIHSQIELFVRKDKIAHYQMSIEFTKSLLDSLKQGKCP